MTLKRQPTIKTLLMLIAVTAMLGVSFPFVIVRHVPLILIGLVSALTFWCLVPLGCGLLIRSQKVIGAICFGLAVAAVAANWFGGLLIVDFNSFSLAKQIAAYVIGGPFDWMFCWVILDTEDPLKLMASYAAWLLAYVANGLLVTRSCRVLESPSRFGIRFRLRTLLIALAVLAVPMAWVSYSLRWIAERHAALGGEKILSGPVELDTEITWPPAALWFFGESGYEKLFWYGSPSKIEEIRRLFPEAAVVQREETDFSDDLLRQ
jgi:hypothetical protein